MILISMERKSFINSTVREPWNVSGLEGFSWPPRSYSCSFCQREFRSAQALGGHMNVHRRDRARLRQSPTNTSTTTLASFLNLSSSRNPNPNPTLSPSSPSSSKSTLLTPDHFTFLSPSYPAASNEEKRQRVEKPDGGLKQLEDSHKVVKRSGEFVRLDLEIGLLGATSHQDLDLELRLGCS